MTTNKTGTIVPKLITMCFPFPEIRYICSHGEASGNLARVGERGESGDLGVVDGVGVSFPFLASLDCDVDDDDDVIPPFILFEAKRKTRERELAKSDDVTRVLLSASRVFVLPPIDDVTFGCVGDVILPPTVGLVGDVASLARVTSSVGCVGEGGSDDRERRRPLRLLESSRQAFVSDDISSCT